MEGIAGYYHFLVGVLNSEYEGNRSFVELYGFTEILPGRITTEQIISPDGETYFNLVKGEIGGNIQIKSHGNRVFISEKQRYSFRKQRLPLEKIEVLFIPNRGSV